MKTIKVYDSTWRRDVVILIESIKYAGRAKDGGTVIFLRDNQEIFTDRELDMVQAMIEGENPAEPNNWADNLSKEQHCLVNVVNEWKAKCEDVQVQLKQSQDECDLLRRRWREEEQIVDRVWKALGFACYQDCGGKTIWELVAELKAELDSAGEVT